MLKILKCELLIQALSIWALRPRGGGVVVVGDAAVPRFLLAFIFYELKKNNVKLKNNTKLQN